MLFGKSKSKKNGTEKDIVLYGAGGMGKEIAILIGSVNSSSILYTKQNKYRLLGYIDDNLTGEVNGLPILGDDKWLIEHKDSVVCACTVANPEIRKNIIEKLESQGVMFETLIHPDVYIDPTVTIGNGTIIQSSCGVSVNVNIGKGVFLNCGVNVGHDVYVDNFTVCHPKAQISGSCHIGKGVSVGSMSFLYNGLTVGDKAVITPGSIVLKKVKAGTYVMGNPAKVIDIG